MTEQTKQKLKYWLFGLISGGAVATPVTAFFVKRVYDKKISAAEEAAEARGMNVMAEYAMTQQSETVSQSPETTSQPSEPMSQGSEPMSQGTLDDYIAAMSAYQDEDINDWNLDIEDKEGTEKSREITEAHERYLDMIHTKNYDGALTMIPYTISMDQFVNESYMQKSFVNWYEKDNVFEEDLNTIDDPYADFGVTDGHELFVNASLRDDPDVVYIRNEKTATDFEITRVHGSYAEMNGEARNIGDE